MKLGPFVTFGIDAPNPRFFDKARWTSAAMLEAAKGFRRLKAYRQRPIL